MKAQRANFIFLSMFFVLILARTGEGRIRFRGDVKGNGGGAIQCPGRPLEILDFYEARVLGQGELQLGARSEAQAMAEVLLSRLALHSPMRAQQFRIWFENFDKETVFIEGLPLSEIDDLGVELPGDCQWRQVINQNPLLLPENKFYLIDKALWLELSLEQRVGLIFHEFFYRESTSVTSKGVRWLNGLLATNGLNGLPLAERTRIFAAAGLSWAEAQGVVFRLDHAFLIEGQILIQAIAQGGSLFSWQEQDLRLRGDLVEFYPQGQLKSCRILNRLTFPIKDQDLVIETSEYSKDRIYFHPQGGIKEGPMSFDRIWRLSSRSDFELEFRRIGLDENGQIEFLEGAQGVLNVSALAPGGLGPQEWQIQESSRVYFSEDLKVKSFFWGGPKVLRIWNQEVFPRYATGVRLTKTGALESFVSDREGRLKTPEGLWISFQSGDLVSVNLEPSAMKSRRNAKPIVEEVSAIDEDQPRLYSIGVLSCPDRTRLLDYYEGEVLRGFIVPSDQNLAQLLKSLRASMSDRAELYQVWTEKFLDQILSLSEVPNRTTEVFSATDLILKAPVPCRFLKLMATDFNGEFSIQKHLWEDLSEADRAGALLNLSLAQEFFQTHYQGPSSSIYIRNLNSIVPFNRFGGLALWDQIRSLRAAGLNTFRRQGVLIDLTQAFEIFEGRFRSAFPVPGSLWVPTVPASGLGALGESSATQTKEVSLKKDQVLFHRSGAVQSLRFEGSLPLPTQGGELSFETPDRFSQVGLSEDVSPRLYFYPSGQIQKGITTQAGPYRSDGLAIQLAQHRGRWEEMENSFLSFFEDGSVATVTHLSGKLLFEDSINQAKIWLSLAARSNISYYENHRIKEMVTSDSVRLRVQDQPISWKGYLSFSEEGKIRCGFIDQRAILLNKNNVKKSIPKGVQVCFDLDENTL